MVKVEVLDMGGEFKMSTKTWCALEVLSEFPALHGPFARDPKMSHKNRGVSLIVQCPGYQSISTGLT